MSEIYKPHALPPQAAPRRRLWLWTLIAIVCSAFFLVSIIVFYPLSSKNDTVYIYVDSDDTQDSVFAKVEQVAAPPSLLPLQLFSSTWGYDKVRTGRYSLSSSQGTFSFFRTLRNGLQAEISLTLLPVRSMDMMAELLGQQLMTDADTWKALFRDKKFLSQYGITPATLPTLFIPNTYRLYWNITPEKFFARMEKEKAAFWNDVRHEKVRQTGFTPEEIVILASIVEQETAFAPEKPDVAGMYINRLRQGMKLQADPTIKFALGDFTLRRILFEHLSVNSPYNTYLYEGLPPGPIGIPSIESIDAVLNYRHHDYLFMCAKEDLSGSHNFTSSYEEHKANATRYAAALNARGIK